MKRLVSLTTMAAISVLLVPQAFANDYNSGIVTKAPSAEYTDVEFGSGWYLRGDITYNVHGDSRAAFTTIDTNSDAGTIPAQADYDDSLGIRIGFGNYIAPNLRLEATAEQIFDSNFDSNQGISDTVSVETNLNYNARSLFINGYFDLPTVAQFKPYVSGGVGLSRLSYTYTQTFTCNEAADLPCFTPAASLAPGRSATIIRNEEDWVGGYQVGGGIGWKIDDHWTADLGYTFTSLGSDEQFVYEDGSAIDQDGFALHQVRLGVRYDIW